MKAMILAAGLGTRLRPYTDHRPKALLTLNRKPVLGLNIEKVRNAGFRAVLVNTHHHHHQIEEFVARTDFGIRVQTRYEPQILGTGGALRNVADYWQADTLLVINADIVSDIDLAAVYRYHQSHDFPVTMVLHDCARFNSVGIDKAGFVTRFQYSCGDQGREQSMAFTGIHVLDPRVRDFLPHQGPAHIITTYGEMLAAGEKIKAYIARDHIWHDIGTPRRYHRAAVDHMAPLAFETAFGPPSKGCIQQHRLPGDGSDRRWYRLEKNGQTLIMADHGILPAPGQQAADAYIAIGRHLERCGVPVPRIYLHDRYSGLVFVEDLGDQLLQTELKPMKTGEIHRRYCQVIDAWITMAMEGCRGFDTAWTYQSPRYDRRVVLENECRYFVEAYIQGHLGWDTPYAALESEFRLIADRIEEFAVTGFMHRDLQSRNIMVKDEKIYFVDFQGGRLGPLQYDLAALLIDPYAGLSPTLQQQLCTHGAAELQRRYGIDPDDFRRGYGVCALARNLQILGAFAYLSGSKGKTWFADYIPGAITTLHRNLCAIPSPGLPELKSLAEKLLEVKPEKV